MKLKRIMLRSLVGLLALCLVLPLSFASCSSKGKTLVSLDGYEISTNIYQLMLTQQKGSMAYSIHSTYGDVNSNKFWDMTIDYKTQATNEEYYNDLILTRAKNYLCALKLYDELSAEKSDFKMPDAYTENIDHAIDDLIEYDGNGSKTALNAILADYGINVKMLREFLIMDAKANYVVEYLYGVEGEKIGDGVKDEYFEENYVSCKQILIQKYYYIYETDKEGNTIYYDTETGYIAYDKSKTPATDDEGKSVYDKNGNRIYYNDDGSIAYDTKNGKPKIVTDENGAEQYKMYTNEELAELKKKAEELVVKAQATDLNGFNILRRENSDDYDDTGTDKTDGTLYLAKNVDYFTVSSELLDKMTTGLASMEIGEIRLFESDLSFNIVVKTELESGAYADESFKGYFEDEIYGVYDFITNLKYDLYSARLAKYTDKIVVNEDVLKSLGFSIANVAPNYYYPDPDVAYYLYTGEE